MSEALREWLDREMRDFEPVRKSFRSRQQRMYYLWMAAAVAGMTALGLIAGYGWAYVLRVHLPIGAGIAVFIWLCVLLTGRAGTMKYVRNSFEKALSALSPADQEALARQEFGRADFLNTLEDGLPARLLVGPDFWLYFRNVCQVYRVADMKTLRAREEKTQIHYRAGGVRMRRKVSAGVSLEVGWREDAGAAKGRPERVYLAGWEQFRTAKELIARHCPKAGNLWVKEHNEV